MTPSETSSVTPRTTSTSARTKHHAANAPPTIVPVVRGGRNSISGVEPRGGGRGSLLAGDRHGHDPAGVGRVAAADGVEEERLQLARHRADAAVADLAVVHLDHGREVRRGPGHEALVGDVELGAVDRALDDLETELLARQLHDGGERDALE